MAKDKNGKDSPAEACEGDHTDPPKRAEVDWSYDPGYLRRHNRVVEMLSRRRRRERRASR